MFPSILVSPAEDSNPFVRFGQDFSKKQVEKNEKYTTANKDGQTKMRAGIFYKIWELFPEGLFDIVEMTLDDL